MMSLQSLLSARQPFRLQHPAFSSECCDGNAKMFYVMIVLYYLHYMHQRVLEETGKRGKKTYNYLSLLPALSACFAQDFQNENTRMMQGYSITSL